MILDIGQINNGVIRNVIAIPSFTENCGWILIDSDWNSAFLGFVDLLPTIEFQGSSALVESFGFVQVKDFLEGFKHIWLLGGQVIQVLFQSNWK